MAVTSVETYNHLVEVLPIKDLYEVTARIDPDHTHQHTTLSMAKCCLMVLCGKRVSAINLEIMVELKLINKNLKLLNRGRQLIWAAYSDFYPLVTV